MKQFVNIIIIKHHIVIALLISAMGLIFAFTAHDCDWFPRSGCVLVVFGMILGKQNLKDLKEENQNNTPNNSTHQITLKARLILNPSIQRKLIMDFWIVVAGTLIWGFGDWLLGLFFNFCV